MNNLALFDFDGTLTNSDSLSIFLENYIGIKRYYYIKYVLCSIHYFLYNIRLISSEKLKKIIVKKCLQNKRYEDIVSNAAVFCKKDINQIIKKTAIMKLEEHKKSGDLVVIVSASLEIILQEFIDKTKIKLIANKLEFKNGICTGEIIGNDCNGQEKVRRIKEKYDLDSFEKIYAYGDTEGDMPMLNISDYPNYRLFK